MECACVELHIEYMHTYKYWLHMYITFLPSNKKIGGNQAKIQANNSNYSISLSGGFLMRVDFPTGTLLEVLESLLSFATVDGKIQSSNVDN